MTNSPPHIVYDDRITIDGIHLFCNHALTICHHFCYVIGVFIKYRLSFKLSKCDFFQSRVEYVGQDITTYGNCLTASKFDLLQRYPLPSHGISLLFRIGLC